MSAPALKLAGEFAPNPKAIVAHDYQVVSLREVYLPRDMAMLDTPDRVAEYYRAHIATDLRHRGDVESFYVVMLNTRRRVMGHHLVSNGTLDTILVHPREVFRAAIIAGASAVVLMHNHPSGESTPSEADIKVTRDMIRAGQILKMEVLDHVIMGHQEQTSLRALGYFAV